MKLKQYIKVCNVTRLQEEITNSGAVNGFSGINSYFDEQNQPTVEIYGTEITNLQELDSIINNHSPEPSLIEVKAIKCKEIKFKTNTLMNQGFAFDSNNFSLAGDAKLHWLSLKALQSLQSFPIIISTISGNEYELQETNLNSFVGVALGTYKSYLDSERDLIVQVNNCTTIEQVEQINDNR